MRKIGLVFSVASILAICLWRPPEALATSCGGSITVQEAVEASDVVFFGEIREITDQVGYLYRTVVTYDVLSTWKGPIVSQQVVYRLERTEGTTADLLGKRHIVYADRNEDGRLGTSICIYIRPREQWYANELNLLGPGTPPVPEEAIAAYERELADVLPGPDSGEWVPYLLAASGLVAVIVVLVAIARYRKRRLRISGDEV